MRRGEIIKEPSMRCHYNFSGFDPLFCSTHKTVSFTLVETPLIWSFDFTIGQRYLLNQTASALLISAGNDKTPGRYPLVARNCRGFAKPLERRQYYWCIIIGSNSNFDKQRFMIFERLAHRFICCLITEMHVRMVHLLVLLPKLGWRWFLYVSRG